MKKFHRSAAIAAAALLAVAGGIGAAGCGKKKVNDANVLNVVCLSKGYGDRWIRTIAERFEAEHEGIRVNLTAAANAQETIRKNINSKNNVDDLYISIGTDWKQYAAAGLLAPLDDILDDSVDGLPLQDKINPEYRQSIYYTGRDGTHTYRLPWTAGIGGIYYNKKLFDLYEWPVPSTYGELTALCARIVAEAQPVPTPGSRDVIKPFIYTSENTDYFDYAVFNWWGQLAGKDAIGSFLNYADASVFDTTRNPTYAKLKTATGMWQKLFEKDSYYYTGTDKDNTQQAFTTGKAAMMFNAEWLYNETLGYNNGGEYANFELALMSTPPADGAVDQNISYIVGEDQYIAVPAVSIKQDLAKDFIKLIAGDFGCKTFLREANGMLAYQCDFTETDAPNTFTKSLVAYRNTKDTFFTNFSSSTMYLKDNVDIWAKGAFRPFQKILQGTSLDSAFSTIASEAARQWSSWQ